MTALKAHEVERFVRRPDLEAGIVLAYGPDSGLVRETVQKLVQHFTRGDASGMGLVTLDGGDLDADPGALLVEAKTGSLFGEKRIVRVRSAGKSLTVPLSELAADPAGAIVILEAGNLAPRDPLRALVEAAKTGRALPCYADSDETVLKLINETFSMAGIRMDADVAPTLRDQLGNDREVTRRELEKLTLYAAESKLLTREDVLTLCADNAALVIDEVADAIGTGHAGRLDTALGRALAAAVNPQQLLTAVSQHFAQLRRWRTQVDAGVSPRDVLEGARPKPHFSRRSALEQQLRLWSDAALATAADRLHTATGDSRKNYGRSDTVVRRVFLALAQMAAQH
ncbi:MAG: DNA polymerase III subunit delta [Devosia nanyangense]|uniref:DNA-directed DNA polymerase n=1 Tax=Devosia nanyangense TaxID=1228055 RepID=A0A933L261_9HYPH|nr:DNA polymerase III subunit delta [Devosia nanyangense]